MPNESGVRMPHLTVEYSNNLGAQDFQGLLTDLNAELLASGQFEEIDIKSRLIRLDDYLIGSQWSRQHGFIHVRLAMLKGRSLEIRQMLSQRLLAQLARCCRAQAGLQLQCSVEITEIDRDCYAKQTITN